MKHISFLFTAGLLIIGIAGCGKNCRDVNCPTVPPPFFGFRLTNSANKDILTGTFKVYDSSQLRIRAKRVNSSTLETIDRFFNYTGDTVAYTAFTVNNAYAAYYLQLNGTITDSFFFSYNKKATDCCDLSNYSLSSINTTPITGFELPVSYVLKK